MHGLTTVPRTCAECAGTERDCYLGLYLPERNRTVYFCCVDCLQKYAEARERRRKHIRR